MFDKENIAQGLPKAIAAAEKRHRVNSQVRVELVMTDVNPDNVEQLVGDMDVVLNGTDNFEAQLLLNDACAYGLGR